jgi:hypothetical protein
MIAHVHEAQNPYWGVHDFHAMCQPHIRKDQNRRRVDHEELITAELDIQTATSREGKRRRLAGADLSDVFGVDMEEPVKPHRKTSAVRKKPIRKSKKAFTPTAAAANLISANTPWLRLPEWLNIRRSKP